MIKLKQLREEQKLTQKEFGLQIGYSQRAISNWENGVTEPNIDNLKQIAGFFKVSIDYLLGMTDEWGNTTAIQQSPAELSADKKELLTVYNSLSPARKQDVLTFAKSFASADASKK